MIGGGVEELWRAICSEENEGSAAVMRFHDGREEVADGGS